MKFYHGSKEIVETPFVHGSNPNNDYGPSFYTTLNFDDACIWASRNGSVGYVNEYEVNLDHLKILDLTDKTKFSVLHWIAILLRFRVFDHPFERLHQGRIKKIIEKYSINLDEYDVIKGYRADDAYFRFPKEFIRGNISVELLEQVFSLGELGVQYAFHSIKAIQHLKFKKATLTNKKYVGQYFEQVKNATTLFDRLLEQSIDSNEGTRIGELLK